MKVKKNKVLLFIILLFIVSISALILFYYPFNNILVQLIQKGFSGSIDYNTYYSKNQLKTDIQKYDLEIELDSKEKIIKGVAKLEGQIVDTIINQLDLNFYDNLKIESLTLNGKNTDYTHADNKLSIFSNEKIDQFVVMVKYKGSPSSVGLGSFNFEEIGDDVYIYSLSEPIFSSTWFPCNDLPNDKALAEIKIINDSSAVSISNGVLVGIDIVGSKRKFHWKTKYPISTYLIAIYSGIYKNFSDQYITISGDTLNLDYYVTPNKFEKAKIDFAVHPEILEYFEDLFGAYPFVEEKYSVVEFFWPYGAMEHQTVTGIGSKFISGKNFFRDIYIHELAHHWWGNAVGPETWKDVWLNEGFATYSEALYWEKRNGKDALISTMFSLRGSFLQNELYDPGVNMFSRLTYNKGAWVLHMLRKKIGDDVFFKVLRNYFETFKYKNASTSDFKSVAENISNRNLSKFFEQWVYAGKGILELSYFTNFQQEKSKYKTEICMRQIQEDYEAYYFTLDVETIAKNGNKSRFEFSIESKDTCIYVITEYIPNKVILDPDSWLLASITEVDSLE